MQHSCIAITSSPQEFHSFFDDEQIEVLDAIHITEKLDRIVYRMREEFAEPPSTNCIPIAAMITAYGRFALYKKMIEAVGNGAKLLYCDTDSLVLKRKEDCPAIKEGKYE